MTKPVTVGDYMTASPHTVGQTQELAVAHALMREHHVHHLPVLHSGALVGMVTLLDLDFVESFDISSSETMTVEEAMSTELYLVKKQTPLAAVTKEMLARSVSSAVIVDANKHVEGVFSTVDALRALSDLLNES